MKLSKYFALALVVCSLACSAFGQKESAKVAIVPPGDRIAFNTTASPRLQAVLDDAVVAVLTANAKLGFKDNELAATLLDLSDPTNISTASRNGELKLYPASVVKLFYLAALERQIEDKKIKATDELRRGERDMIVDSSNEATQYILDVLTGTSSGGELPAREFEAWQFKRNRVNRYFAAMGYQHINVNQKTFCEDAYGIEQQSRNYQGRNRNMLTTNATARLMAEIVMGRIAGSDQTVKMLELLRRDPFGKGDAEDQAHGFTGKMLIDRGLHDARLWSKAGWTSTTRHDAAYIETADGLKFVLVVFTIDHANEKTVIPSIASHVLDGLMKTHK